MKINKIKINQSDSIGLFLYLKDDILFLSKNINNKKEIEDFFDNIKKVYIDYPIIYPFILEYEDNIILSKSAPDIIKSEISKYFDIIEVETRENLLGNLFILNNNKILYSYAHKIDIEILKNIFNFDVIKLKTIYPLGAISKIYKNKILIGYVPKINDLINNIKNNTNFEKIDYSTINFGTPYLRYGIVINDNYILSGYNSSGQEILKIKEFFFNP